jgi:hypothetical protein
VFERGLVGAPAQVQFGRVLAGEGDGEDPVQPAGSQDRFDVGLLVFA